MIAIRCLSIRVAVVKVECVPASAVGAGATAARRVRDAPAVVQTSMTGFNRLVALGPFEVPLAGSYPLERALLEQLRIGKIG